VPRLSQNEGDAANVATIIHCPSCQNQVGVPDELLGKLVQCPQCKAKYIAGAASTPAPSPKPILEITADPEPAAPAVLEGAVAATANRQEGDPETADEERPRRRRERDDDRDDDRERRPRRRVRRPRGMSVESKVIGPAIALMVVGAGGMLITLALLILNIVGIASVASAAPRGTKVDEGLLVGTIVRMVLGTISTLAMSGVVLSGGMRMKNRSGYGYAVAASVIAMLPCQCCFLIGFPVGVWSLIILLQDDVKRDFD
jgi:hypothetical protein